MALRPKTPKLLITDLVLIFALMPLLAFLSFSSYQMVISYNRTLLPPTKQPQPISAHPDVPLPTNQQPIERTATVPRQDLSAFRAHLATPAQTVAGSYRTTDVKPCSSPCRSRIFGSWTPSSQPRCSG